MTPQKTAHATTTFLLITASFALGCGQSGPPSVNTVSDPFATTEEKEEALEQYVLFDRNYEELDFKIAYQNNSGGMVPGPSEWDICIIAVIPESEVPEWSAGLTPVQDADTEWTKEVPTEIDHSGVNTWFEKGHALVGIDEDNSVVAYRNQAM